MMEREIGIDLSRLIGAFFIVFIHASYGDLDLIYIEHIHLTSKWAVPFFFIISGYFLNKKISHASSFKFKVIEKNIISLFSILLIANLVYLPFAIRTNSFDLNFENILTGVSKHLWFIESLIFGYIFIWFLYAVGRQKQLFIISLLLIVLSLFLNAYQRYLSVDMDRWIGRFILSIPCMYIGMRIASRETQRKPYLLLIGIILFGFCIQLLEAKTFKLNFGIMYYDHYLLIGTLCIAIPFFMLVSFLNIKPNMLSDWGRKYSLFIYLYHPISFCFLVFFTKLVFPSIANSLAIFNPIIGFIITLTAGIILDRKLNPLFNVLIGNLIREKQKHKLT